MLHSPLCASQICFGSEDTSIKYLQCSVQLLKLLLIFKAVPQILQCLKYYVKRSKLNVGHVYFIQKFTGYQVEYS
jgi:hypothetical protein